MDYLITEFEHTVEPNISQSAIQTEEKENENELNKNDSIENEHTLHNSCNNVNESNIVKQTTDFCNNLENKLLETPLRSINTDCKMKLKTTEETNVTKKSIGNIAVYSCPICNKEFKYKASRYTHIARFHNLPMQFGIVHCLELGCNFSCGFTVVLQKHLMKVHNIPMNYSHYEFDSFKDFETWKHDYEKKEFCRFVRRSGSRKKSGKISAYLYCSRSGKFVSRSTGKKKMKKIGTSKISAHCTASIKYFQDAGGKIKVVLCSTHYGHQKDYRYLRITKGDKNAIVEKLKFGVPRDILLDTVRSSCAVNKIDKLHLISNKDLDNIERANKIVTNPGINRRAHRIKYIDEWVDGICQSGQETSILFYKKKDFSDMFLNKEDECIILMTPGQTDVCSKLSDNSVIYATVLLLPHLGNFYLTSLLIVDEFRSTFPIAFMICNRRDDKAMELFFSKLMDKMGSIRLRAFVTDNLEYIFNAWSKVMGSVGHHIWANRYVDEEWRDYLSVIADEKLQVNVYDEIYQFIEHSDDSYKLRLQEVVCNISSKPECSVFGQYLKDYFLDSVHLWATCYIKDSTGISEPINFDMTYNKIREVFEYGNIKYVKYLSSSVQELIKLMVNFHVERNKNICSVLEEIQKTHKMNSTDDMQNVFPFQKGTWKIAVPGTSNDTTNPETITEDRCIFGENCVLRCDKCMICVHMMKCSCQYYVTNFVCKHIHLLASLLKLKQGPAIISTENTEQTFSDDTQNEINYVDSILNFDDDVEKGSNTTTVVNKSQMEIRNLRLIKKNSAKLALKNKIRNKLNYSKNLTLNLKQNSSLLKAHKILNGFMRKIKTIYNADYTGKSYRRQKYFASKKRINNLKCNNNLTPELNNSPQVKRTKSNVRQKDVPIECITKNVEIENDSSPKLEISNQIPNENEKQVISPEVETPKNNVYEKKLQLKDISVENITENGVIKNENFQKVEIQLNQIPNDKKNRVIFTRVKSPKNNVYGKQPETKDISIESVTKNVAIENENLSKVETQLNQVQNDKEKWEVSPRTINVKNNVYGKQVEPKHISIEGVAKNIAIESENLLKVEKHSIDKKKGVISSAVKSPKNNVYGKKLELKGISIESITKNVEIKNGSLSKLEIPNEKEKREISPEVKPPKKYVYGKKLQPKDISVENVIKNVTIGNESLPKVETQSNQTSDNKKKRVISTPIKNSRSNVCKKKLESKVIPAENVTKKVAVKNENLLKVGTQSNQIPNNKKKRVMTELSVLKTYSRHKTYLEIYKEVVNIPNGKEIINTSKL